MVKDDEFTDKITQDFDHGDTTEEFEETKKTRSKLLVGVIIGSVFIFICLVSTIVFIYLSSKTLDTLEQRIEVKEVENLELIKELEMEFKDLVSGNGENIEAIEKLLELRAQVNKDKFEAIHDKLYQQKVDNFALERKLIELANNVTNVSTSDVITIGYTGTLLLGIQFVMTVIVNTR